MPAQLPPSYSDLEAALTRTRTELEAERERSRALVEAADRMAAWLESQTHDIHDAAHGGQMSLCDRPRCQTTTERIDAYRQAVATGGGAGGEQEVG